MKTIEQITNSIPMSELVLKVMELVEVYNTEQQKTDEIKNLIEFGSTVVAEVLHNKLWYLHSISEFSSNAQLLVGDSILLLGEHFSFWKIILRSESSDEDITVDVSNPELVAVQISQGFVTESHLNMPEDEFQIKLNESIGVDIPTDGSYENNILLSQLVDDTAPETFENKELEV